MTKNTSLFSKIEIDKFLLSIPAVDCPKYLLIKTQRDKTPIQMPLHDAEKLLKFHYRPHLTFESLEAFLWTLRQCPFLLRSSYIATENHELFARFKNEIYQGLTAAVSIRWVNPIKEFGLFAEENLSSGCFIGEYTGIVRRLSKFHQKANGYCFLYPTMLWSMLGCTIDALKYGNVMRFANHDDLPNMDLYCLVDRDLLHMVLRAKRDIQAGEELTFDYGPDYWIHRQKKI